MFVCKRWGSKRNQWLTLPFKQGEIQTHNLPINVFLFISFYEIFKPFINKIKQNAQMRKYIWKIAKRTFCSSYDLLTVMKHHSKGMGSALPNSPIKGPDVQDKSYTIKSTLTNEKKEIGGKISSFRWTEISVKPIWKYAHRLSNWMISLWRLVLLSLLFCLIFPSFSLS